MNDRTPMPAHAFDKDDAGDDLAFYAPARLVRRTIELPRMVGLTHIPPFTSPSRVPTFGRLLMYQGWRSDSNCSRFDATITPMPLLAQQSLLSNVEAEVCELLGITRLRHRSALKSLRVPEDLDLPSIVYRTVARNWAEGAAAANIDRSRQNWRWTLQPNISAANSSPKVVLERAIAAACVSEGRDDWANQIPVASGLVAGAGDGRRAIDLAQHHGGQHYELIELKVASDTPLYAAVELLG